MAQKKLPELIESRIVTAKNKPSLSDLRRGALILINKPLEWTSFDVVNKIRSSIKYGLGIKKMKVGHAGTLDPMATGLLLVCVGKYTKIIEGLTSHIKSYEAIVKLGATTPTYDREADEENIVENLSITSEAFSKACHSFLGRSEQIPPIYSAIKINGQSAHKLARRGKDVQMKKRKITISEMEILDFSSPLGSINVTCTKGTYIRSLANDIGAQLGCGGYLYGLKRTFVDKFDLNDAIEMEEVISWIDTLPKEQEEL